MKPGDVYRPTQHWLLVVTASHVNDLVNPDSLRSCQERLRPKASPDLILCFHVIDLYRGKTSMVVRTNNDPSQQFSASLSSRRMDPHIL